VALILEWDDKCKLDCGEIKQSAKKAKHADPISAEEKRKIKAIKSELSGNAEALKVMLRRNGLAVSGTKDALLERIAEAKVLGSIPKCSLCGGGRPAWDKKYGYWVCKGYLDDVVWEDCSFISTSVTRVPWINEDGEEENENLEEEESS